MPVEVRLYDRLFKVEDLNSVDGDFKDYLNPDSLKVATGLAEPELLNARLGEHYQFLRMGYFCLDQNSTSEKLVFNRTVTLRDVRARR